VLLGVARIDEHVLHDRSWARDLDRQHSGVDAFFRPRRAPPHAVHALQRLRERDRLVRTRIAKSEPRPSAADVINRREQAVHLLVRPRVAWRTDVDDEPAAKSARDHVLGRRERALLDAVPAAIGTGHWHRDPL